MLTKDMMQEIQNLKLQGYTPGQIHTRFLEKGGKDLLVTGPSSSGKTYLCNALCWSSTILTLKSSS